MVPKSGSRKLKVGEHIVFAFLVLFLLGMIVYIIARSYGFSWTAWTDFLDWSWTSIRTKSLWDWLQLFIVPIMLLVGGFWFNQRLRIQGEQITEQRSEIERQASEKRAQTDRDIATDNQREKSLQDYIDKISELLFQENLHKSDSENIAREVARIRTLTVLSRLDGSRKGSVIKFLNEGGLIDKDKHIIDLHGADLSTINFSEAALYGVDLCGADMRNSDLHNAKLDGSDLSETDLLNVNLSGATLNEADLHGANLSGVNLSTADLIRVNLSGATLSGADLHHSNLSGANLDRATLSGADLHHSNLSGANLDRATLSGADLSNVDLSKSTLSRVDLHKANLIGVDLSEAQLDHVDLRGADLRKAYFGNVDLSEATLNLDGADLRDPRVTKDETLIDVDVYSKYAHYFSHAKYDSGEYTVAYIQDSKYMLIVRLIPVMVFLILIIMCIFFSFWFYILFICFMILFQILFIYLFYLRDFVVLTNKSIIHDGSKIEYKNMRDIRANNILQRWLEIVPSDSFRCDFLSVISNALTRWPEVDQADSVQRTEPSLLSYFLGSTYWHILSIIKNVLHRWLEIGDLHIELTGGVPDFIISNIDHYLLLKSEIFRMKDYDEKEREGKMVATLVEGDEPTRNRTMTAIELVPQLEAENTTLQAEPKNK
jgi:uncharacterized protein YjbI with pentapeptide repeats